jgi:hypothetical protein
VSDASGQMEDQDFPSNGMLGVPLRANSVLQARVRVSEYASLQGRLRGGLLKGLMFVHLKKDLETSPVDWIDSQDPSTPAPNKPLTSYGVQRSVQRKLAEIRTDLDSFSEAEAYALMADGYLMTKAALEKPILGFALEQQPSVDWEFLKIAPLMRAPEQSAPLQKQLKVANFLAFKVWLLMRRLQLAGGAFVVLLLALVGNLIVKHWGQPLSIHYELPFKSIIITLLSFLFTLAGLGVVAKVINYRKTVQEILIGLGMATIGFLAARLHLHVFDKLFLWQGKLSRLLARSRHEPVPAPPPDRVTAA